MGNRLANETSPYLLQHKDNPVDWFPWGEAAFAEARRRDVPVFLSVGYSTCYWCHVMERQVFEKEDLAGQMNAAFVNVKVDREERPDVDEHYMTATQVLAGQGGWPMNVVLTPDGEPFFAGTYFPPTDMPGRPGFGRVVEAISDAWKNRRDEVMQTTTDLRTILERLAAPRPADREIRFDGQLIADLLRRSVEDYEPRFGGFGRAPKFPRETLLQMLLRARRLEAPTPPDLDDQLRHTLDAMAHGGIRDHLGGGFHRYSTDAKWLVPHFEIMLYDQAMLALVYVEAAQQFGNDRYARVARSILDFVLREMTDESGAFYTAIDAEVDALEGGSYLWTPDQVREVLGEEDAKTFNAVYGLAQGFNFADPHGPTPHAPDWNVLFLADPSREDEPAVGEMREKLRLARSERKQPLLDTKVITSWNGLMIGALATAGRALAEPRYTAAAERAANWLLRHHRNSHGGLLRSSREGVSKPIDGFLEDYAYLANALVEVAEATGNAVYRDHAGELLDYLDTRFRDPERGGYFETEAGGEGGGVLPDPLRRKTAGDNPLPSPNGAVAGVLMRLGRSEEAQGVVSVFAGQIVEHPDGCSTLLGSAVELVQRSGPFTVEASSPEAEAQGVVRITEARWATPQRLELTIEIAEPFHLYADDVEGVAGVALTSSHPAFERVENAQGVGGEYRGEQVFALVFSAPASDGPVPLELRYQACDESRCLMPVRMQVELRPAAD